MKKDLLICVPPSTFFHDLLKFETEFKYLNPTVSILNDQIDRTRWNVDFKDYDAQLIKSEKSMSVFLKKTVISDLHAIENLVNPYIPTKKYDYVLLLGHYEIKNQTIGMLVIIFYALKILEQHPNTKILIGGIFWPAWPDKEKAIADCQINREPLPNKYNSFLSIINQLQWPLENKLPPNITLVPHLYSAKVPLDIWNEINVDPVLNPYNTIKSNSIIYSRITAPITESDEYEKLKYSYADIFEKYSIDIPEHREKYIQQAGITLAAGCPNNCAFCEESGRGLTVSKFDESKRVIESHLEQGFNSFFFLDCSSNVYASKLCNWISKNNIKISWSASFNLNTKNPDFWSMLFESGCRIIDVGVESPVPSTMKFIEKPLTLNDIQTNLQLAHKAGLYVSANFIIGFPYETQEKILETLAFIIAYKDFIDATTINHFFMYPQSKFCLQHKKYNISVKPKKGGYGIRYMEWQETEDVEMYQNVRKSFIDNRNSMYKYFKKQQINMWPRPNQHLIFALYEIFKNKRNVKQWINENYY